MTSGLSPRARFDELGSGLESLALRFLDLSPCRGCITPCLIFDENFLGDAEAVSEFGGRGFAEAAFLRDGLMVLRIVRTWSMDDYTA